MGECALLNRLPDSHLCTFICDWFGLAWKQEPGGEKFLVSLEIVPGVLLLRAKVFLTLGSTSLWVPPNVPISESLVQEGVVSVLHQHCPSRLLGSQRMFCISGFKPLCSVAMSFFFFCPCHRRVAAFEAKQNQLREQQKGAAKPPGRAGSGYQGLSKEDRAIAERLERLREERKPSEFWRILEILWVGMLLLGKYEMWREKGGAGLSDPVFLGNWRVKIGQSIYVLLPQWPDSAVIFNVPVSFFASWGFPWNCISILGPCLTSKIAFAFSIVWGKSLCQAQQEQNEIRVFGQTILQMVSCESLSWTTAVPVSVGSCSYQPCLTEEKKDSFPSPQLSGSLAALWCLWENKQFKKLYVISKRERTHCKMATWLSQNHLGWKDP